tara:strand:+ start:3127 stop:3546 length:420 start_codon:yes stop_codon:yes gene_type:complete
MAKMKNIGRAECRTLSEELEVVIQRAVNKYGLTASYANGRYGGHTATFSFKLDVPAMAEKVANRDAELLGANFNVGHVFMSNGEEFRVTGFNMRRRKYPVSADNTRTGKGYKFTIESLNRNIEIAELFKKSKEKEKVTS